jgi:hypothetical protein
VSLPRRTSGPSPPPAGSGTGWRSTPSSIPIDVDPTGPERGRAGHFFPARRRLAPPSITLNDGGRRGGHPADPAEGRSVIGPARRGPEYPGAGEQAPGIGGTRGAAGGAGRATGSEGLDPRPWRPFLEGRSCEAKISNRPPGTTRATPAFLGHLNSLIAHIIQERA